MKKFKSLKEAQEFLATVPDLKAEGVEEIAVTAESILAAADEILAADYDSPADMATDVAALRDAINQLVTSIDDAVEATPDADVEAVEEEASKCVGKLEKLSKMLAKKNATVAKSIATRTALGGVTIPSPAHKSAMTRTPIITGGMPYKGKAFASFGAQAHEKAYIAGRQIASLFGDASSKQWLQEKGLPILTKAQSTIDNALGGYLVTPEIEQGLREYREQYGQARANMEVKSTSTDTYIFNRAPSGAIVYAMGEGVDSVESTSKGKQHFVNVKKFGTHTIVNMELTEDSYVNVAEEFSKDHGHAHAVKEDAVLISGDGTGTYNGLIGVVAAIKKTVTDAGGTWATDAHKIYNPSVKVATGATVATVVDVDIIGLQAKLGRYAGLQPKFYTYSTFYFEKMLPLARATGGVTSLEMINGVPTHLYNGVPVVIIEEIETNVATAANSIPLFYGDMSQAGILVDRMGISIESNDTLEWLSDQTVIKSRVRYGSNWWNLGVASSTAGLRVRGALAALALKA